MVSFMQSRLGPMEAGPYGSLQLFAEVGKFLQKEDLFPDEADRLIFALAPIVVFISVVPRLRRRAVRARRHRSPTSTTGIFFALAVSSLSVLGILMAGWASANKYSLMGGLRAAGQLIAYELPMVLAVVGVVIQAGTLNMQGIVCAQADGEIFGFGGSATRTSSPSSSASSSSSSPRRPSSPRRRSTCPSPSPSSSPAT